MALLQLKNVTMRFGGLTAVQQVSLAVEPGQIFAVIGPNGAGKTTVFNVVTGIYEPTEGEILLHGHREGLPFTWRTLLKTLLIAICTGLALFVFCINIDKLWQQSIKRAMAEATAAKQPFSYARAWDLALAYWHGGLVLEEDDFGWLVKTPNGADVLGLTDTKEDAKKLQDKLEILLAMADPTAAPAQARGDTWVVLDAAGQVITSYPSEEKMRRDLAKLAAVQKDRVTLHRTALGGLVLGFLLGGLGSFAIWWQTRRTPEVIALAGIARTFQNIRLFKEMTVLENVVVAMDRTFTTGLRGIVLAVLGIRRQELAAIARAMELLDFVGLAGQANSLARNLPYGDQRRLEIARALATKPALLLLDEPAAGMNPSETGSLIQLISKIREQGVTILLIEHHMSLVMAISDRIAVLDHGVKIAEGTPQEVRNNPAVIEAYLGKEEVA